MFGSVVGVERCASFKREKTSYLAVLYVSKAYDKYVEGGIVV